MLLTWVALVLTAPAMHLCLAHNARPFPMEPSAAVATDTNLENSPVELQALRIRIYQTPTPPVVPAIDRLRILDGSRVNMMPSKGAIRYSSLKPWIGLAVAEHAAAAFDAWSTRASLKTGYTRELDPIVKPFAQSAAIYPVLQLMPIVSDLLSRKMLHSSHPLFRKIWWLPQTTNMTASMFSGIHNLRMN
jgi:hypothetical protein